MMRRLAILVCLVLASAPLFGQTSSDDVLPVADTISSNGDAVTIRNLKSGRGTAAIEVSNICTCTLVVEGQVTAGSNWEAVDGAPTIEADGIYYVTASGLTGLRVRASAWSSTTTTINIRVSSAGGGNGGGGGSVGGGGDGAIEDGASSTIKATVLDLTNSNPLTVVAVDGAGTAFSIASETTVNTVATNTGLMVERFDTLIGRIQVADQEGNPASAYGTQPFFRFDDVTPSSVAEDTVGGARISANRNQYMQLRDGQGNERGQYVNASGQALTLEGNSAAMLTALQLIDNLAASPDPCSVNAKQYLPINISTATTTEITASLAGASTHYYVCSINIGPTAGAQNIALVDDDTDNCASVTSGVAGGTTAGTGWNAAANGGLVFGNGLGSIARTNGTNRVLCLVTSASVQTSGVITVVAAP